MLECCERLSDAVSFPMAFGSYKRENEETKLDSLIDGLRRYPWLLTERGKPIPVSQSNEFAKNPENWILARFPAQVRRSEWIAGRLATIEACKNAESRLGTHTRTHAQPWLVSTSHCSTIAVACAALAGDAGGGIGIDVEPANRTLSRGVVTRILSPHEIQMQTQLGFTEIGAWVIKEAVFKASGNPALTVGAIRLESVVTRGQGVFEGTASAAGAIREAKFWLCCGAEYAIAVAVAQQISVPL